MLGNGWTVDVIKHIFQYLPFKKAREASVRLAELLKQERNAKARLRNLNSKTMFDEKFYTFGKEFNAQVAYRKWLSFHDRESRYRSLPCAPFIYNVSAQPPNNISVPSERDKESTTQKTRLYHSHR